MATVTGTGFYARLGIRPVINAKGSLTVLGGSTIPESVMEAMNEANLHQVEMQELIEKVGDEMAGFLGVEAAYVTSGCAAALTLSAAACMAGTDPDKIGQLPDTTGMKSEIIIQKKQRYGFDRCYTVPGATLVEVGDESGCTSEQLEEALGDKTAAIAYPIPDIPDSSVVSLEEAVATAHGRGIPVIADAASQIYPLDFFVANAQAADLVCFGAKYFGAPHSSGLVCGKKDIVDAVAAQGFIAFHMNRQRAIGRAMKLDRQEIVGVAVALERWFTMNHEDRFLAYDRKFSAIQRGLAGVPDVKTEVVPYKRFFGFGLHVTIDPTALGKNAAQVESELDEGNPRIWVRTQGDDTIIIIPHNLGDGEEDVIADRLRSLLIG